MRKKKEKHNKMKYNKISHIDDEGKKMDQHGSIEKTIIDKKQKKDINGN